MPSTFHSPALIPILVFLGAFGDKCAPNETADSEMWIRAPENDSHQNIFPGHHRANVSKSQTQTLVAGSAYLSTCPSVLLYVASGKPYSLPRLAYFKMRNSTGVPPKEIAKISS